MDNTTTKSKSTSVISWGHLFIIFGTVCLFLFALTQRVNFEKKEPIPVIGYTISGGTIVGYDGTDEVLTIPSSYSLGETTNFSGTVTFNNRSQALNFLQEHYATGAEGYYDFYNEIYSHSYPWTYTYSIDKPSYIAGDDFQITSIANDAFQNNTTIKKAIIPSSIQSIGSFAFQYCSNLTEIEFEEGLKRIGDSTFWGCAFKEVTLPNSVERISPYAFFRCESLETVVIGENLTDISHGTFNNCTNLKTVTIKSKHEVESWYTDYYQHFSRCPNLETIYIHEEVWDFYHNTMPWSMWSDKYKLIEQ